MNKSPITKCPICNISSTLDNLKYQIARVAREEYKSNINTEKKHYRYRQYLLAINQKESKILVSK